MPSVKTNRLWFGILTTLCTVASVPMLNRSTGCGESTRASRCATTTIVLSSPRELISCTELSRPTVSGRTAWGNSTVSRTGRIGNDRSSGSFGSFGCMLRSERDFSGISLLECVVLKFDDVDAGKDADHHFPTTAWILLPPSAVLHETKGWSKKFPQRAGFQHSAQIFAAGYIPSTLTKSVKVLGIYPAAK